MKFIELSPSEERIINELRNLKPFEKIEINADNQGRYDKFLVFKSQKFILDSGLVTGVLFKS